MGTKFRRTRLLAPIVLRLRFYMTCLSVKAREDKLSAVHMLYECFSGYTRVAKGSTLLRNAGVHATGEAVLLDLETGGQLLVYWDGGRYRTKLVRLGD